MGTYDGDDTQKGLPSAAYWRQRAEKAREAARDMRVGELRQTLLGIAKIYESMADRAAEREARKSSPAARAPPPGPSPEDNREQA